MTALRLRARRVAAAGALAASGMLGVAMAGAPAQAVDTGTPPVYAATLGGSGQADMYPSGAEVAPDGTLVVADTGSNQIEKYRADGSAVWRVGSYGFGAGQYNNPRDVGVDSAGNIYVADTANLRIVKLSSTGAWLASTKGATGDLIKSPIGLSVSNDLVYVADGATKKVRVFDTSLRQVRAFSSNGACTFSALRDVDADSAGNVYVANYTLHNILKLTSTGTCITKWGTKGTADGQFAAPYGVRIARDPGLGRQLAYVADSNNNRIQVFELSGEHLATMGAPGTHDQLGTFTQLRRVAVAGDGDVWGADLWGWRMERWNRASTVNGRPTYAPAQRIGTRTPQLSDSEVFHEPRQIAFDPAGNLRVADTVHHRIVRLTPQGRVLDACGMRGSDDGELNWPRGVAIDPVTGDIWMADTKQSRLQVVPASCSGGQRIGTKGTGVGNFHWPMSIAIRPSDRTAWVADTNNNRITVWDVATRTPLASFGSLGSGAGQFNQPRGVTVAPNGSIYVADRTNNRIVELSAGARGTGIEVVRTITAGLNKPEGVAVDGSGRIYVADTLNDRLVALTAEGVLLGSTSGPSGMRDPAAVSVGPDDRIYVADTYNDRILAFTAPADGAGDTVAPTVAIGSPAAGATVDLPLAADGTAADDRGVTGVDIALKDIATNQWWDARNMRWGPFRWNPTVLADPGATSTAWAVELPGSGRTGSHLVQVRAVDGAGNLSTFVNRRITLR